jgi:hypothetical protein
MIMSVFGMATYVASGFAGSVGLESANRDAVRSLDRANSATLAESGLRHAVENLSGDDAVTRWATFHRFKAPYTLAAPAPTKPKH